MRYNQSGARHIPSGARQGLNGVRRSGAGEQLGVSSTGSWGLASGTELFGGRVGLLWSLHADSSDSKGDVTCVLSLQEYHIVHGL